MIIVVYHDKVAQLQVTGDTCCFAGNALHSAAVTENTICMIVDNLEARFVEVGSGLCLSNCQTNGIGKPLAQWASCDLDPWCILGFGVAGCDAIDSLNEFVRQYSRPRVRSWSAYTEGFDIVHCELVAEQMEQSIL